MFDESWDGGGFGGGASPARRRFRIWELENNFQCSVVGTCLTPGMVRQLMRRAGMTPEPGLPAYVLHSQLVTEATKPGLVARLMTKLLDDAYAGTVRRVMATPGEEALGDLWDGLCEQGQVAAAYWAFITHGQLPPDLRLRIFGEVHMLSHFMGGHNHASARELWQARRHAEQLADRLDRLRRQAAAGTALRDERILRLESELQATRLRLAQETARKSAARRVRRTRGGLGQDRLQRRVAAVRARLRQAEEENERLRRLLTLLAEEPTPAGSPCADTATAHEGEQARCLLYVGGRCTLLPHLRRHAESRRVELLHHDGGEEQSLHLLEGLVGRADAVFCPIDCISHQACQAAKQLCRRLEKPFVPLRTSSGTCFVRAMNRWRGVEHPAKYKTAGSPSAS